MENFVFSIHKLGGDSDEALLRFIAPTPRIEPAECYVENDQLTNLAHVLSKFLRSNDQIRTTYVLGSFEESYAGGALRMTLARNKIGIRCTIEMIDGESKGVERPETYSGELATDDIERFADALKNLHDAELGFATLQSSRV